MAAQLKHYADSSELERLWTKWLDTKDGNTWKDLQDGIYKICKGVATQFSPQSEEEHLELSHETFVLTIDKINDGRLLFKPGKAPVFNLLTTTIFRHLYSLKNKQSRRNKLLLTKYVLQPDIINKIVEDKADIIKMAMATKTNSNNNRDLKLEYPGSKYIIDPMAFIDNDEYKLLSMLVKKNKQSSLLIQLLRSNSKMRRSIEIFDDYTSFLYELIDVLTDKPSSYKFSFGGTSKGLPIEVSTKTVYRSVSGDNFKFFNILFLPMKLLIAIEYSRIDGLITFIEKFNIIK